MDNVAFIIWMRDDLLGKYPRTWEGISDAILDGVFTRGEIIDLLQRCAEVAGYRKSGKHSWLRNIRGIRKRLVENRPLTLNQMVRVRECALAADVMLRSFGQRL